MLLFIFSVSFFVPKTAEAVGLQEVLTSENSFVVKIKEEIEYFFAFKIEAKVQVLERHAEKRLSMAREYAEDGNKERVQNVLQNYLQIKERQNVLLGKTNEAEVMGEVEEKTIEQQRIMEEIKTMVDEDGKQEVVRVQEQVVNQVAQRVVEINGPEGQTEFFNKVEDVWAPGTGPGGEAGTTFAPGTSGVGSGGVTIQGGGTQFVPGTSAGGSGGVVVEGGTIQFAPGTSSGGPAGSDIKTVEVKTGGGDSGGSGSGGGGTTVESGNQNANPETDTTRTWIDP